MKTMAIIIQKDAYDLILTGLAFAYLGTAVYDEINILCVNWVVKLLSKEGVKIKLDHPDASLAHIQENLTKAGLPTDLYDIVKTLKGTGKVHFYACSLAAAIFDVDQKDLIPEADGIVGATWFLTEKAESASIFMQY
jgi:peroxiredoxin family protein